MPKGIYNRNKMKTDLPQPPVVPTKGVGPQVRIGSEGADDAPPTIRPIAAVTPNPVATSFAAAASPPVQSEPQDIFGNAIEKPKREEALASALMALVRRIEDVGSHPEMKALFKLGQQQRIWTGAAGNWGQELKTAKEVLGI